MTDYTMKLRQYIAIIMNSTYVHINKETDIKVEEY